MAEAEALGQVAVAEDVVSPGLQHPVKDARVFQGRRRIQRAAVDGETL